MGIGIIDARLRRREMVVSPAPAVTLVLDMLAFDDSESLWQIDFTGIESVSLLTDPPAAASAAHDIAGDLRATVAQEGHYQLIVEQFDIRIDTDVPPQVRRLT